MSPAGRPENYLRYANMAVQMALIIALAAWGGKKLDSYYHNSKPVFTIVLSLVGIAAALYISLKDLIKPKS
ncbi:MAG TPA: AtpZ/AtpI family protein [Bacteroidia bacterium]|nr:AtpZ/AtpI family protein [Bacteroidia bacterium]